MFDIIHRRRKRSFLAVNKSLRNLIGREPGVTPDHTNNWDVNCGEDVSWRPGQDKRSHQDEQQGRHHKGVGSTKS